MNRPSPQTPILADAHNSIVGLVSFYSKAVQELAQENEALKSSLLAATTSNQALRQELDALKSRAAGLPDKT
jgi:hypothetical protein